MAINNDKIKQQEDFLKEKVDFIIKMIDEFTEQQKLLIEDTKKNIENIIEESKHKYKDLKNVKDIFTYFVEIEEKINKETINSIEKIETNWYRFTHDLSDEKNKLKEKLDLEVKKINRIDYGDGTFNAIKTFMVKKSKNFMKSRDKTYIDLTNKIKILSTQLDNNSLNETEFHKNIRKIYNEIKSLNYEPLLKKEQELKQEDLEFSKSYKEIKSPKSQLYKECNNLNYINKAILLNDFLGDITYENFNKLNNGISKDVEKYFDNLANSLTENKESLISTITIIKKPTMENIKKMCFDSNENINLNEYHLQRWQGDFVKAEFTKSIGATVKTLGEKLDKIKKFDVQQLTGFMVNSVVLSTLTYISYQSSALFNKPASFINLENKYAEVAQNLNNKFYFKMNDVINSTTNSYEKSYVYQLVYDKTFQTSENFSKIIDNLNSEELKTIANNDKDFGSKLIERTNTIILNKEVKKEGQQILANNISITKQKEIGIDV